MERDDTGHSFEDPHRGSAPAGMTPADVEGRSQLARHLETSRFPATASEIRDMARSAQAPDLVNAELSRLPDGRYGNVTEVWAALGHGVEAPRTETGESGA